MNSFTLPCGCVILYELSNVGEYGYGGEIWEITEGRLEATCRDHTRPPSPERNEHSGE